MMPVSFNDVTLLLPDINGESSATWSVTWYDINADGRPDLYVNNHGDQPAVLFVSWGDTHFFRWEVPDTEKDVHTAIWADYDGDGAPELLESTGGGFGEGLGWKRSSNTLFEIEDARLEVARDHLGLAYPQSRGRGLTPFDFDGDGRLDVFLGAGVRPDGKAPATVMLQNDSGRYAAAPDHFGTDMAGVTGLLPGRFDDDFAMDYALLGPTGIEVLQSRGGSFEREVVFRDDGSVRDFIVDDFNNDGRSDIWIARALRFDQLARLDDRTLRFEMVTGNGGDSTDRISFKTDGPITLRSAPDDGDGPREIVYGSGSIAADPSGDVHLDSRSEAVFGRPGALDGERRVLGVWYAPKTGVWHVEAGGGRESSTLAMVEAASTIRWAGYRGLDDAPDEPDLLFLGRPDGTFRETRPVASVPTASVASGDFDNDGDLDVYADVTGTAGNLVNRLYVNDGRGQFSELFGAWGAPGAAGGIGDTATSIDFNEDGWLDLFGSSGDSAASFLPDSEYVLYQNAGGTDGWLDVTLRAEDGDPVTLGSIVTARSASHAQMRIYDAGVRLRGQDDPDLHFGLGSADAARVVVRWRDDVTTVVSGVPADTRLTVWRGSHRQDTMVGSGRSDVLLGEHGADRLDGSTGRDWLSGGAGADGIVGGPGDDRLWGGWRSDRLGPGLGHDVLHGGPGADGFVFVSVAAAGHDAIVDFEPRLDRIDLRRIDADPDHPGDQGFRLIWAAAFSGAAGELRYVNGVLAGDVEGDQVADFRIGIGGPIYAADVML